MSNAPIETTSTTIQGQFLEVAIALEKAVDDPRNGIDRVTIDPDTIAGTVQITATIPINVVTQGDSIILTATTDYPTGSSAS